MESAVSRKDRIVASAIEIISESGLEALSTKTLAMKGNMSESLLYKYFGGLEEVLIAVVEQFVQFDERIAATIDSRKSSYVGKLKEYFDTYATYYGNYMEITALVLNYENLLHNYSVREMIAGSITIKRDTVKRLIGEAIKAGEISDYFEPEELTNMLLGTMNSLLLDRRVTYHERALKDEMSELMTKMLNSVTK
ncbi:MAG: TetR/AcrR family transcriptional regulator [Lachnospiraceae bacterium]|nr:TetR/AcrR family transcriptional regulator [Lachnospiraceae bacterium]